MPTARYDTVKMVEGLEGAGVPAIQAQAHAALVVDALENQDASIVQRFAGKLELAHEQAALRTVLERLDAKLDVTMEKVDARLERFDAKLERLDSKLDASIAKVDAKLERLDSKFDASIAKVDATLDAGIAKLEAKLDVNVVKLNAKLDGGIEKFGDKMAMLDLKIDKSAAEVKGEMMRWVVSVGILQIAVISGLILKFVH